MPRACGPLWTSKPPPHARAPATLTGTRTHYARAREADTWNKVRIQTERNRTRSDCSVFGVYGPEMASSPSPDPFLTLTNIVYVVVSCVSVIYHAHEHSCWIAGSIQRRCSRLRGGKGYPPPQIIASEVPPHRCALVRSIYRVPGGAYYLPHAVGWEGPSLPSSVGKRGEGNPPPNPEREGKTRKVKEND